MLLGGGLAGRSTAAEVERDSEGIGLRAWGTGSVAAGGSFGEFGFE